MNYEIQSIVMASGNFFVSNFVFRLNQLSIFALKINLNLTNFALASVAPRCSSAI